MNQTYVRRSLIAIACPPQLFPVTEIVVRMYVQEYNPLQSYYDTKGTEKNIQLDHNSK